MDEKARPDGEHDKEQDPPLPSSIIRKEANGNQQDDSEDADRQAAQADNPKKKPRASVPRRIRGAWNGTSIANRMMVVFTSVIAFANIVYVIVGGCQWRTMRDQLGVMEGQLDQTRAGWHLEYRPWVTVDGARLDRTFTENPTKCIVILKNTGRTPAVDVQIVSRVVVSRATPDTRNFLQGNPEDILSQGILAPNGSWKQTLSLTMISKDIFTQIKRREQRFYVLGRITYLDVFKERHWSTFRYTCIDPNACDLVIDQKGTNMDLPP